jgi:Ser/Thr protein kinase RdoA (MazF antagonist)
MDVAAVATSLGWSLVEKCAGGEFGAYEVRRGSERAVLKVFAAELDHDALVGSVELTDRARAAGQLAPRYLDVGRYDDRTYSLQEWADGVLPERLSAATAAQMVDLLDTHAGVGAGWSGPAGFTPWWDQIEVLRDAGHDIADELAEVLRDDPGPQFDGDDVVHSDYHFRNVLVRGDAVISVIDWDATAVGDRWSDAVLLMWWCRAAPELATPEAADLLQRVVETNLDDKRLARYAARMARTVLDFNQRTYPRTMARWLASVDEILAPYWRR